MGKFWCKVLGHSWRQWWNYQYSSVGRSVESVPAGYYCTRCLAGK